MEGIIIAPVTQEITEGAREYGVNVNHLSFCGTEEMHQTIGPIRKFLKTLRSTFSPVMVEPCTDIYFEDGVTFVVISDNGCEYVFCNDFDYLFNILNLK